MAQNLQLDPTLQDYVLVNGSPVPSDRMEEATYFALTIPQGKGLYQTVNQGSQLYTLENIRRSSSVDQQFATLAQDAIKRNVIQPGKGTSSQVANIAFNSRATSNQIEVIPAQTELSSQLNFTPV
jgi:phage gp46-like protein